MYISTDSLKFRYSQLNKDWVSMPAKLQTAMINEMRAIKLELARRSNVEIKAD